MKTLQLQFFDHAKGEYADTCLMDVNTDSKGAREALEKLADYARKTSARTGWRIPWRIASTERPLKPKYNAPRGNSKSRTVEQIQIEYVTWANAKGLTHITIYRSDAGKVAFARWYGEKTYITQEEQFAVTESYDAPRSGDGFAPRYFP